MADVPRIRINNPNLLNLGSVIVQLKPCKIRAIQVVFLSNDNS